MVGTPESKSFFEQALHLARRSMGLSYEGLEMDEYFCNFCSRIFDYQYTEKTSPVSSRIIQYLYEHSGGVISNVISLFHDAQEIAIIEGTEVVDLETLNKAYYNRMKMLHVFIEHRRIKMPQARGGSIEKVDKVQATTEMKNEKTIYSIIKEAKTNGNDPVNGLRVWFTVEEVTTIT